MHVFKDLAQWQPFRLEPLGPIWIKGGGDFAIRSYEPARSMRPFEKVYPVGDADCIKGADDVLDRDSV